MPRKLVKSFLSVLAIFVIATGGAYLMMVNSSAMEFAESEVRKSTALAREIGPVYKVKLDWRKAFRAKDGQANSVAKLTVIAIGERGERRISLLLRRENYFWSVAESSMVL